MLRKNDCPPPRPALGATAHAQARWPGLKDLSRMCGIRKKKKKKKTKKAQKRIPNQNSFYWRKSTKLKGNEVSGFVHTRATYLIVWHL